MLACLPCVLLQAYLVCHRAGHVGGGDERRDISALYHSLSGQCQRVVQPAAARCGAQVSTVDSQHNRMACRQGCLFIQIDLEKAADKPGHCLILLMF